MKPLHLFGLTQKKKFSFRKWVTFLFISSAICISFVLVLKINEGKSGFPFCCSFYRYKMGPFCRNILWILLLPWNHAWLAQYLLLQVLVFAPRVGKCLHPGHPKFSKAPLLGPTRQAITLELPRRVGGGLVIDWGIMMIVLIYLHPQKIFWNLLRMQVTQQLKRRIPVFLCCRAGWGIGESFHFKSSFVLLSIV